MVGRKQHAGPFERKGRVVGGVTWRQDRADRPAVAMGKVAVGQRDIGHEAQVGAGIERIDLADAQWPRRPMRTFGKHGGAGVLLQPRRERRMVAVGMADEDVADRPAADRREQRRQMLIVVRPRIDHRERLAADEIAVGAVEGERARVSGGDALHIRRHRDRLAIGGIEAGVEFKRHAGPCCSSGKTIAASSGSQYRKIKASKSATTGKTMATATTMRPLVSLALPSQGAARLATQLFLALAGTLLLTLSAQTKVVLGPVDISLQTLAVLLIAPPFGMRMA